MSTSEKVVEQYLRTLSEAVVFEPDGNVPPDFVVDGRVAVEARRLNQPAPGGKGGLDEIARPLDALIRHAMRSVGPADGASWFVTYTFHRPLLPWKTLRVEVPRRLREFLADTKKTDRAKIGRLTLTFIRASTPHSDAFVMGGSSDHDGGGFIIGDLLDALRIYLPEKTGKIAARRDRYPEWWLIFDDRIAHGYLDASEVQRVAADLGAVPECWSRIVLTSPDLPPWILFQRRG